MLKRKFRRVFQASVVLLASAAGQVYAAGVESELADRMAQIGVQLGRRNGVVDPEWRLRGALFDAAVQLDPEDGRLLRYKLEAALHTGDPASAMEAVTALRKLEPQNTYFQARQIDVALARLETADAKLKYLGDIVAAEALAAEVRSYAATRAAWLHWEQSRSSLAVELIRKAVVLNPLNLDALRLQWRAISPTASPIERTNMLLAMLRANPGLPDASAMLADELAAAGLYKSANNWYDYSLGLARRTTAGMPLQVGCNYAASLYLAGRNQEAGEWLQRILKSDGTDPSAIFLLSTLTQKDTPQVQQAALEGLLQRLQMVRSAAGIVAAASRPALGPATMPSLDGDVAMIQGEHKDMAGAYSAALADLAWLLIYYQHDTAGAQAVIDVLKKIDPADSAVVGRLEGWSWLVAGKTDEARVKLTAVAARDPLARLGVIELMKKDPAQQAAARVEAKKLMESSASGVIGVIIRQRLADLGVKTDLSPIAESLRDAADRYPQQLTRLALVPQEFYAAQASADLVQHEFGQPIMLTVTLRNQSDQALTLGEGGMLRDIYFDVQLRGGMQQGIPAAAYLKLTGPLILQPHAGYSQMLRLDEDMLGDLLNAMPAPTLQMSASAIVNAISTETGTAPGIFGYRAPVDRMMVRTGMPLMTQEQVQAALATLEGNDTTKRLRVVDAAASQLATALEGRAGTEVAPALTDAWKLLLDKSTRSASPHVNAWAMFRKATVGTGNAASVDALIAQPTWYAHLLAALASSQFQAPAKKASLARLAADENAIVRRVAAAVLAMPDAPPPGSTTAPTSRATSAPARTATPMDGPASVPAAN